MSKSVIDRKTEQAFKEEGPIESFIRLIDHSLLPALEITSPHPFEPVVVKELPKPWKIVGTGNYAAVLLHPDFEDWVVKIYAPGREGLEEEVEVYARLGRHPAFSECLHAGETHLILKRLKGITLYDCLRKGIRIPIQAIEDIENALNAAREKGLRPNDIHAKNVMLVGGRGAVVDVSDFLEQEDCEMWDDLKKAYYKLYVPLLLRRPMPLPSFVLNGIRKGYRWLRKKSS
jgi:hypothetical protein